MNYHAIENPWRETYFPGSSVVRLHVPSARIPGLIPGQGTKIPHTGWCGQKKELMGKCYMLFAK